MQAAAIFHSAFRRAASRQRMIALYWFVHTLCAAIAALPLLGAVIPHSAHSGYAAEMLRHFDLMYAAELVAAVRDSALGVAAIPVLLSILTAMLASVFLAGGAVKLLVHDGLPYSPGEFWEGCGRHFWRFLRLAVYSLLLYSAAFAIARGVDKAADKLWGRGMLEQPVVYASWARQALLLLLLGFISAAMDLAKVRLVADDSRRSLRACFGSARLALRRLGAIFPVWLGLGLMLVAATWLYVSIANRMDAFTAAPIAALFLVQQCYIAVRVCLRMMSWGAAAALDPVLRPPAPVAAVPEAPAGVQEDFVI